MLNKMYFDYTLHIFQILVFGINAFYLKNFNK